MTSLELDLLEEVFKSSSGSFQTVDARRFKVTHRKYLAEIEGLVRRGLLIDSNNSYRVSLHAISKLQSDLASATMANMAILFEAFRKSYIESLDQERTLGSLANETTLSVEQIESCLVYLLDYSVWYGGSSVDELGANKWIKPGESILRFDDLTAMLAQIEKQASEQLPAVPITLDVLQGGTFTPSAAPLSPIWAKQLPQHLESLLSELYTAQRAGCFALAAMGIRAAIDTAITDMQGVDGTFAGRLDKLLKTGNLSLQDKMDLEHVIGLGHASAHRAHVPSARDIELALIVCERLLAYHFITSKALKTIVYPSRTPAATNDSSI